MRTRWWISLLCLGSALSSGVTYTLCRGHLSFSSSSPDDRAVEPGEQRRVANHEAGHAVVASVLLAPGDVQDITVFSVLDDGLYGVVHLKDHNRLETAQDIRNDVTVFLAGRAADVVLNGAATNGATRDLDRANDLMWGLYIRSGLGGSLLVDARSDAPSSVRDEIDADLHAQEARAEAIVAANRPVVAGLAELVMAQPERDGKRVLSGDAFRAYMKAHPAANAAPRCVPPLLCPDH